MGEEERPLERALAKGNKEQLECFLRAGVDPNHRDRQDNTLLYNAVKHKQFSIVEVLLRHKANPLVMNLNGETAIHLASRMGEMGLCQMLCRVSGTMTCKNMRNLLPIQIAAKENFEEIVGLYLRELPELAEVRDQSGKTLEELCTSENIKRMVGRVRNWRRRVAILYVRKFSKLFDRVPDGIFSLLVQFI
jgi:ankyrin repeat protein